MRKDLINNWIKKNNQILTESQLNKMATFQEMVLSAPINLTAITSDEDFAIKHFIDSLTLLPYIDEHEKNTSCVDVGTGAGFPGIPIKIARPDIKMTLLDSLNKRVLFLREVVEKLGLNGVECIHARAEDVKDKYDLAIARAVARLDKLAMYVLPLVKQGGVFLAMKGPEVSEEIKNAKPVLDKFGSRVENIHKVEISPGMTHTIIKIVKG